jgi:subtilisin family serine protease
LSFNPKEFPSMKLMQAIVSAAVLAAGGAAHAAADTTRVIVAFKPGAAAAARQAVAAARGNVKLEIAGMDAMAVEVPAAALRGLARNPNIEYVEDDALRYPLALTTPSTGNPYASGQLVPYGIPMVQADQLSDAGAGTRKVCIIDSGYDRGHEDLNADAADVTGEFDAGTQWWYTDENGHGTHVAGTIAALNNAGKGVVGVAPNGNLKLHIVKVFGASGWAYSSTLANAANKCKAAGANIISMSLGGSRSVKTEQKAFDSLYAGGILSIAAAGNDGNTRNSYPASYSSVVSVAAVDVNKAWATFSQYNSQVEIAGPGVGVLSTVPRGSGLASSLTVGSSTYAPGDMDGSPKLSRSGALADFGLGNAVLGGMTGKVCLIQRGSVDFATKVSNCQASGGVGAVVYNNAAGGFGGTLGTTVTNIPSVTASDTEGAAMLGQLGQTATVTVAAADYAYFDGTSMATPHVSAVAALVWSHNPGCTAAQLRNSLNKSAQDLGPAGRDTKFGFGLVQAKAADARIKGLGCGN